MTVVLVVEDETLVRLVTVAQLESEGYTVLTAGSADEAIALLEARNDVDTIFTDIEMPGSMDGLKLAAAVRHRWPPVKIVITSGKAAPRREHMPAGSIFVSKPYSRKDVVNALTAAG